jgi:SAM-dependent methyltransferase
VSDIPPVPDAPWFNEVAAYLGPAYLRNAFTKGTDQEVGFLVEHLALKEGMRVLDAGCGPGRHGLALARLGIEVVGIDLSPDFIELARQAAEAEQLPARFKVADIRDLNYDRAFDAVICLCQGGFGLLGGGDSELGVIDRLAHALKPGASLAVSAFSAYFAVRHLESSETFEADTGVQHERATVRGPDGAEAEFDLWTTCYTPRELRLLARRAGLHDIHIYAVTPGDYAARPPSIDTPEHLLVARRPAG